ncbi:tyrosine-type recombinase/integrase [Robertmurraya massiliosenegalensis]|uniref:tyrosine-type recombinase/integrase n=1 Tax=Robertmurraya TaxID=2837507 RepID=UPI0039A52782
MSTSVLQPLIEETLLKVDNKLDIFTLDEYLRIRNIFGYSNNDYVKMFRVLKENGMFSKNQLSSITLKFMKKFSPHLQAELLSYITINMLFARLPMNREIIETYVYKTPSPQRKSALYYVYKKAKPKYFPELNDVQDEQNRLKYLYTSLVLFYKPNELSDEVVINELVKHCGKGGIFAALKGNRVERIRQFVTISAYDFIQNGILLQRDNLLEYLFNRTMGKETLNEEDKIWKHFHERMDKHSNTEFFLALELQVNEYFSKKNSKAATIETKIRCWADFTDFAINNECVCLKDVTPVLRDIYIGAYLYEKSLINDFGHIRTIIRNYNENIYGSDIDKYFDDTIFSQIHIPKKPRDATHIAYMESAHGALVSSVYSEIYKTKVELEKALWSNEIQKRFFLSRIIWLTFLTGARISEISELELDKVKSTLKHKKPYFIIKTKKKNSDRVFELYRGKNNEYDMVHFDILNETIKISERMYENVKEPSSKTRWLFPNQFLKHFSHSQLSNYLDGVQKKNAIICGSHYDIMQRDLYNSYQDMERKVEEPTPLFSLHEIRHMHIDKLVLYGMTNSIEIAKTIGHQNEESQETYKKAAFGVMDVAKLMEENDHYGAKNKLVSPSSFIIDDSINRKQMLLNNDIEIYLDELKINEHITNEQAIDYIDINTNCETKVSCGENGLGCLGCNDFVSGRASHEAVLNFAVILENQLKVIDFEIQRLNDKNLRKKQQFNSFQMLLMTILDRFEGIEKAKSRTLLAQENFNWSNEEAVKFLSKLVKRVRKVDFDKEVIKMIKNEMNKGKLHDGIVSRIHLIVSRTNKKVFS